MEKIRLTIIFTLASFISVTAYEVYTSTLAGFNFGFALLLFQGIAVLVLETLYPHLVRNLFPQKMDREDASQKGITLKEVYHKRPALVIQLGIGSCIRFGLMLPLLNTLDDSLLFIIFYALSGLLKVPFSVLKFNDPIINPKMYWFGLMTATVGGILFAVNPLQPQHLFEGNWTLLTIVIVKMPFEIFESIYTRELTQEDRRRNIVQKTEEIKALFNIVFGLLIGLAIFFFHHEKTVSLTGQQLSGILWIGIVVTLTGTLSTQLTNKLTSVITQPIQSIRPLLAFFPLAFIYLREGGNNVEFVYKVTCMVIILTGSVICLKNGSPLKETSPGIREN